MSKIYNIVKELTRTIENTFLQWITDEGAYSVVMSDHSDHRPEGPHFSFKILSDINPIGGSDEETMEKDSNGNATGRMVIRAHREFTVSIEAVGKAVGQRGKLKDFVRATDMLNALHLGVDTPTVRARFQEKNIAINDKGTVSDISQFLETETEPRALLEMFCSTRIDIVDEPGYFDSAEVSGSVDTDGDGVYDLDTGLITI